MHFQVRIGYVVEHDPSLSPLEELPEISWSFERRTDYADRDIYDRPIANSADQTYDPPVMIEHYDLSLTVVKNIAYFNPVFAHNYIGTVNADVFWGFPETCVHMTDFSSRAVTQGYFQFWRVRYAFAIRKDSWVLKIADKGLAEKDGKDNNGKPKWKAITDFYSNPVSKEVFLDGNGKILNDGADVVLRQHAIYPLNVFSLLGLA